jgi:hypothetical protein
VGSSGILQRVMPALVDAKLAELRISAPAGFAQAGRRRDERPAGSPKRANVYQIFVYILLIGNDNFRLVKISPRRCRAHNYAPVTALYKEPCTDLSTSFVDKQ